EPRRGAGRCGRPKRRGWRRRAGRAALGAGGRPAGGAHAGLRAHPRARRPRGGARVPARLRAAGVHQHGRRAARPLRARPPRPAVDERKPLRDPALAGRADL
ncbi:MAG: hypothetical protein AVDCRST_MAG40-898, partial [uncultured Gemmatimonadaceae bacterium]